MDADLTRVWMQTNIQNVAIKPSLIQLQRWKMVSHPNLRSKFCECRPAEAYFGKKK